MVPQHRDECLPGCHHSDFPGIGVGGSEKMDSTGSIMDGAAGIVESTDVVASFVGRFLTARVNEEESRGFARQPAEVIAFTLLVIQTRMGRQHPGQPGPNTPPAAIPPYQKTASRPKNGNARKRGGQARHPERSRERPVQPVRTRRHRLNRCPDCRKKLRPTRETRLPCPRFLYQGL